MTPILPDISLIESWINLINPFKGQLILRVHGYGDFSPEGDCQRPAGLKRLMRGFRV